MKKIKCYDKDGNSINHFIQWDKNQEIYIDDLENGIIPEAHFATSENQNESRIYLDAVSQTSDKSIKIIIPNDLLVRSTRLFIFLYYKIGTEKESQTTKYFIEVPVKEKPRPSDQIYEDNLIFLSLSVVKEELRVLKSIVNDNKDIMDSHINDKSNPHNVTVEQMGALPASMKGNANGLAELDENRLVPSSQLPSYVDDIVDAYLSNSEMFKDENLSTKIKPEKSKIYLDLNSNNTYRWSGTQYTEVSKSLALGETNNTAYRGDRGKISYDHSQSKHARIDATLTEKSTTNGNLKINGNEVQIYKHPDGRNPHGLTVEDLGLENVDNTHDVDKPISKLTQTALDGLNSDVNNITERIDDLESGIFNPSSESLKKAILEIAYPIGSIYHSVKNVSPETFIGGKWEIWGTGRTPVGVNQNDSNFNAVEKIGGESVHTLIDQEVPNHRHTVGNHSHSIPALSGTAASNGNHAHTADGNLTAASAGSHIHGHTLSVTGDGAHGHSGDTLYLTAQRASGNVNTNAPHPQGTGVYKGTVIIPQSGGHSHWIGGGINSGGAHTHDITGNTNTTGAHTHSVSTNANTTGASSPSTTDYGGSKGHNNLQPYITCYMWKRIS